MRVSNLPLPHCSTLHLCHQVREIGSPGEQLQSCFQSQFPAELCVTLLATFQKLYSLQRQLWSGPLPPFSPAFAEEHVSRTRVHLERLRCLWAELCSSWEGGRPRTRGEKKKGKRKESLWESSLALGSPLPFTWQLHAFWGWANLLVWVHHALSSRCCYRFQHFPFFLVGCCLLNQEL